MSRNKLDRRTKIRNWLLIKLAGKRPVIMNVSLIIVEPIEIGVSDRGLISRTSVTVSEISPQQVDRFIKVIYRQFGVPFDPGPARELLAEIVYPPSAYHIKGEDNFRYGD